MNDERGAAPLGADELTIDVATSPTDDVRALIDELDRTLAAEYSPDQQHGLTLAEIFTPNVRFFVARLNGAAVACGGVALLGTYGEVKRMYVRDGVRGRGFAAAVLARLESEARRAGVAMLRLETGERQFAALRLYQRAGFVCCAAFGQYATMPAAAISTSVFLEKRLFTPAV